VQIILPDFRPRFFNQALRFPVSDPIQPRTVVARSVGRQVGVFLVGSKGISFLSRRPSPHRRPWHPGFASSRQTWDPPP
jgi:hypothetical protein